MSPIREDFVAYESIEGIVKEYLNVFSGKTFNLIAPFDHTPPTLENIGEVFYSDLSEVLLKNGYQLKKLGISENPQRVFNISGHNITEAENLRIKEAVVNLRNDPKTTGYASLPTTQSMPEKVEPPTFREELTDSQTENALPKSANYSKEILVMQVIILIAAGAAAMIYVRISNMYPLGMDIHGHLFKADLMYHRLREGDLYPLYTELWYNGIQPFRYWPPLPYYLLAIFQFIFSGNVMNAYLLFIWTSFSVGAIGWLMFARKLARPWLGFFFALTWFLFPDNLRVFFGEGNLPRMFIAMIAPYLFYCLWQYVFYQKKKMAIPLLILMTVAIMGHLMIAAMIGVASTIFLLLYVILNKRWIESVQAILVMFFSFALCGIWVYPSLLGGITAMSSEATSSMVALVSEKLSTSLNPFYRLEDGIATLYFGLSIVLIALVGLLFSNRRSMPGFITFLIFVLGTASAFAPLIVNIPLSQYLWVRRFIPIVYVLFVIALLEWKSLKKPVLVVMCCLIMLDILPSLALNKFNQRMNIPATNDVISQTMDAYLFSKAKSITKQRISLMDLSMFGPMPSYGFCSVDPQTQYVFGWAWQASVTAMNIAYLNESLEMKNYSYMFDRNLELGADVVLVDKRQVKSSVDRREMFSAAEIVGYSLIEESDYSLLFSYPVDSTFGVITQYECLAIGTTAALVPGILPYYHPGDKLFIDGRLYNEVEQLIKK